ARAERSQALDLLEDLAGERTQEHLGVDAQRGHAMLLAPLRSHVFAEVLAEPFQAALLDGQHGRGRVAAMADHVGAAGLQGAVQVKAGTVPPEADPGLTPISSQAMSTTGR